MGSLTDILARTVPLGIVGVDLLSRFLCVAAAMRNWGKHNTRRIIHASIACAPAYD